METRSYELFPARIVILSNLVSFLIYTSGLIITLRLDGLLQFYTWYSSLLLNTGC